MEENILWVRGGWSCYYPSSWTEGEQNLRKNRNTRLDQAEGEMNGRAGAARQRVGASSAPGQESRALMLEPSLPTFWSMDHINLVREWGGS